MTDIINQFSLSTLNLLRFGVSIVLAIALGLGISFIYRITHKGLNYESSFTSTLTFLVPIVSFVMFFIQGNLVLSLGLVGSLSIIRFRTPIKDTKDMVFLFWSIVIGLGVGTLNWTLSIIGSLVLAACMYIFYKLNYGQKKHSEYILIIRGNQPFDYKEIDALKSEDIMMNLRSREIEDNQFDIVYELKFDLKNLDQVHELIGQLETNGQINKVSLLSPQLNLPM
jgi:hypothetical protein